MISDLHRCLYVHVPKTAGKSVLAAFGLPMLGQNYTRPLPHIRDPYGHRSLASQAGDPAFGYFKFGFVRNPWDRLVSAFFYLDAGGCNAFDQAYRAAHLAVYGGDFLAFAANLERHLGAAHFRPQVDWLCDAEGQVLADFVGRYERLDQDFARVARRLSLPAELARLNGSLHQPYATHYDARAKARVAALYADDIRVFGYAFGE